MPFIDRMKEARLRKNLTQEQLALQIGVAKPTYNGYEKGNSEPNMLTLTKIMEVLEVDANYLFQDEMRQIRENNATPDEMENLVKKYRALDEHGKETVDSVLAIEYKRCQALQEAAETMPPPDNIIYIRHSWQSSSAGTGTFLGPDSFEIIKVQDNPLTRRASFSVPVSGNSMEPRFYDGDVLLVEAMSDVPIGEIGIFTIDGNGYVKQRGEDALISLNPDYPPIPLTEDSWCNGKVIGVLKPEWVVE